MSYDETMPFGEQRLPAWSDQDEYATDAIGPGAGPATQEPMTVSRREHADLFGPVPAAGAATEILRKPPSVLAWLAVKSGSRAGQLYRLAPHALNIGRDSQNDIILDDSAASRQHARVKLEENEEGADRVYIYDLASGNGTLVNGKEIHRHALANNDEIKIGSTVLVFKQIDDSSRGAEAASEENIAPGLEGEQPSSSTRESQET